MQTTLKIEHVTFVHDDQFKGEVSIARGDQEISVPIEALCRLVAEKVRFDLANHIVKMKPADLLRRIA